MRTRVSSTHLRACWGGREPLSLQVFMTSNDRERVLGRLVIAIDGPSGSGKTTTARLVAQRLALRHLDTGAMYRCVTLRALRYETDPSDAEAVTALAQTADIRFTDGDGRGQRVVLDGEDVSDEIRQPEVTAAVSEISAHRGVRRAMVIRQRRLADEGGVVVEGRDIGSVVLPWADVRVYLEASVDVRAARRTKEFESRGITRDIEQVREDLIERDRYDSTRAESPLKIPVGASIVDTSDITIDEQVDEVIAIVQRTAERVASLIVPPGSPNTFRHMRWYYRMPWILIRVILHGLWGLRIHRKDRNSYAECFIYAANHRSNADPPVVGSTFDTEVYYVAKGALFTWNRAFARLITSWNAIPIRSGLFDRAAMDRFLKLLSDGHSVLIFPEGGRQKGPGLGRGLPGVGYLALNSGASVVPVYIDGTASMKSSLFRRPRLVVRHGRPIRLDPEWLESHRHKDSYRDFGETVIAAIQALKDEHESRS